MAEYRTIQTKMWRDDWFSGLDCESRLLWVYLITNETASVAGIYRLSERYITFETGLAAKRVRAIMESFKAAGRVDFEGDVIWVKKMREYQESKSPKVQARVIKDVSHIPECRVKAEYCQKYGINPNSVKSYSINTVSISGRTDTDTDTDTETERDAADAATPPAPKPKAKDSDSPKPPPDLALATIPHGDELQAALDAHFAGLAKPRPAWNKFASTTQRDAFAELARRLDGEFVRLAKKGFAKERTSREALLGWLDACARNNSGQPFHQPPQQPKRVLRSPLAD